MPSTAAPPLRWGFLGAARIATSYAKAITGSGAGSVLAVASRDLVRARTFAGQHGIARPYGDYHALLADPEIDAIYLALPNALHAPWSIRALEAGKHVLCEKPLAANAAEARAMATAAGRAGRVLMEALMFRRHPVNLKTIELLRTGRIGQLVSMQALFHAPVGPDDPIRFSLELAGGSLRDLGSYALSFLRWAADSEPESVTAQAQAVEPGGVDLHAQAILRFPGGVLGSLACGYATPFACRYELIGTTGRLVSESGPLCAWPGGEFQVTLHDAQGETPFAVAPADAYRLMAEEFARVVQDREAPAWPLADAEANLAALDGLRSSASIP